MTDTLQQPATETDTSIRDHTVVWTEFQVPDLAAAQTFYGAVFGWTFAAFGDGFVIASTPHGMVAGLEERAAPDPNGRQVRVYLQTDDLEAALDRAASAGGAVVQGRQLITEEFGWYGLVADPWGLTFGLTTDRPGPAE